MDASNCEVRHEAWMMCMMQWRSWTHTRYYLVIILCILLATALVDIKRVTALHLLTRHFQRNELLELELSRMYYVITCDIHQQFSPIFGAAKETLFSILIALY